MATTPNGSFESKKTDETRNIEKKLRPHFVRTDAYRYNSASIRVRIIDERFAGKSKPEREDLVTPYLNKLPQDTQANIMVLLLLAPDETKKSLMNLEFEDPRPSRL